MPRLPDVMDYGARPSLRSNRVDPVHEDGVALAESVANAAQAFAQHLGEKKEKDSRLQYALAKNEIIALDIQQRDALNERDDWEAFDNDYTNGFNTGRDEILNRYRLSPSDLALLQSESDLIREKGRVSTGAFARNLEVDQGRARISAQLDIALEQIQLEDAPRKNAMMLQALETINAAIDEGWYTDEEGETLLQGFVSKAALSSLEAMESEDMINEIELSLAHRAARPDAITREQAANNEGSGSIADFLHTDVLKKMLRAAEEDHKNSTQYKTVYDIIDFVTGQVTGTEAADIKERERMALAMLDRSDPEYGEIRQRLLTELTQRNNRDMNNQARADAEMAQDVTDWIDNRVATDPENPPTVGDLRTMPIWSRLSPQSKTALEAYAQQVVEGDGYAIADDDELELQWRMMSPQEKIAELPNLNNATYKSRLTRATHDLWLKEAETHRDSAERPGTLKIWRGDTQDEVLQNMLVGEEGLFRRVPTPGSRDDARYRRIDAAVNRALTEESLRRVADGGTGEILPTDVQEITARVISQEVFIRRGWFDEDLRTVQADVVRFDIARDPQGDDIAINIELEDEAKSAYIPYESWAQEISDVPNPAGEGNLTIEQMLRNFSDDPDDVDIDDLEEAYFYLTALPEKTGLEYARRRIQGEAGL